MAIRCINTDSLSHSGRMLFSLEMPSDADVKSTMEATKEKIKDDLSKVDESNKRADASYNGGNGKSE